MSDITPRLTAAIADRYRLERRLGEGGMATVYLARDLRHERNVALKVLRPELAAVLGGDRFVQEIRTTANLQHPHILPLFDSGTADGFLYYVMPFVDGETLRTKLNRETQLGVDEAVRITREVADALDYAHRHGVIHRDIKPENILLHDGRATVADFGIALAVSAAAGGRMTETGLSLGTPHYMSPEQATAKKDLDSRSDIYSLGSVLYEMLTGDPPHTGASAQAIILKIVADEARPVVELRKWVPPHVAAATAKALERLAADRFETAKAFADALANPAFTWHPADARTSWGGERGLFWKRATLGATAIAAGMTALALWGWFRPTSLPAHSPGGFFTVELPPGVTLPLDPEQPVLALSPDGTRLVFVGEAHGSRQLYVRDLVGPVALPIDGTENASGPFWSPDGAWITFFSGGMIKRVAVGGGAPLAIHAATEPTVNRGATWITNDRLVYAASPNSGLSQGTTVGERPQGHDDWAYVTTDINAPYAWPSALPGGRRVLFTDVVGDTPDRSLICVLSLADKKVSTIVNGGTTARYSATGHLLFVRSGSLYATLFDADHATASGAERKILDGVIVEPNGVAQYAVSGTGTLAYIAGPVVTREFELVWVDRSGGAVTLRDDGREYSFPRLSPDGTRLAVTSPTGSNYDVWILDLLRGSLQPVTTAPGEDFEPVWNPDGTRVAMSSEPEGEEGPGLAWTTGPDFSLAFPLSTPGIGNWEFPTSWSPDGKYVAFTRRRADAAIDVEMLPTSGPASPIAFASDPPSEYGAMFNPNRQLPYVAYVSDVSGREEVYVRPFPGAGHTWAISANGGFEPQWSRDGRELFYRQGDALKSVKFTVSPTLEPSAPTTLFEGKYTRAPYGGRSANYDVSNDGRRFLFVRRKNLPQPTAIRIILNWPAVLLGPAASTSR